jgi:hypothetical protein
MSFLIPEVFILQFIDIIFLMFMVIIFVNSVQIYRSWDIGSVSQQQYHLEKRSYLAATLVKYIFIFKIPLFLFYIYTSDKMSTILTGAMCAAGSINATEYGKYLLYSKIFNIFLFAQWVIYDYYDMKSEKLEFTKRKFGFLIFISVTVLVETILSFLNFNSIDPNAVVSCCSTLYNSTSDGINILGSIPSEILFVSFIISYFVLLLFYLTKNVFFISISSALFFLLSIPSLTYYVSTYIYELPTHKCPFCIIQGDYFYIGYFLYITLFLGTVSGISSFIVQKINYGYPKKIVLFSFIFVTLYFLISIFYPLAYYMKNGVWL